MEAFSETDSESGERAQRFTSHALVELRKFRWWPFSIHSAILLDLSIAGYKLEFTGEYQARPGHTYWINIPLSPLGIIAPKRLVCKGECRWFDPARQRMGGVFVSLTVEDQQVINQVIESLRRRGKGIG